MLEHPDIDVRLDAVGAAIQGSRSEQQDSFRLRRLESEDAWLLVLADGMGGHAGGELASKIAVEGFVATFVALRAGGKNLEEAFRTSAEDANARLAKVQQARPEMADMGATLAAAHISKRGVAWISVGDSPIWLLHDRSFSRLNEDHSLRGLGGQAKGAANMLRSALNGKPIPLIDCHSDPVPLSAYDVVLLASDGILTLDDKSIANVLSSDSGLDPTLLSENLLKEVLTRKKSNQDNCTVVVASVLPVHPSADSNGAERQSKIRVNYAGPAVIATALGLVGALSALIFFMLR
jgi:PPM family protein phosphatase